MMPQLQNAWRMFNDHPLGVALALILVCQSMIAGSQVLQLIHYVTDPLIVLDTKVANPSVKFGDALEVEHTYKRKEFCKVDIDRFVIRVRDERLVRRERLPAGTTLIGTYIRTVGIPTKDLLPGERYVLREFLHSDCGDRMHTSLIPDVEFEVTE